MILKSFAELSAKDLKSKESNSNSEIPKSTSQISFNSGMSIAVSSLFLTN